MREKVKQKHLLKNNTTNPRRNKASWYGIKNAY